jgi:hypothetical protein
MTKRNRPLAVLTPPQTYATVPLVDRMKSYAEENIKYGQRACDAWAEKFAANPSYAFEWSQGTFREAARLVVGQHLKRYLESDNFNLEQFAAWVEDEVVQRAGSPHHSTSVPSNLMHEAVTEQWAQFYRTYKDAIKKDVNMPPISA